MGNYATSAQVIARLGTVKAAQLTSDTGSTPDTDKINEAIGIAEGDMDSRFAKRFRPPVDLTAHPEIAVRARGVAIDIAVWHLAKLRPPIPEDWTTAYEFALKWLAEVSKGESELGTTDTPTSTTSNDPIAVLTGEAQNASRTNMASL